MTGEGQKPPSGREKERRDRQAEQLRENLRRRKAQARARGPGAAADPGPRQGNQGEKSEES